MRQVPFHLSVGKKTDIWVDKNDFNVTILNTFTKILVANIYLKLFIAPMSSKEIIGLSYYRQSSKIQKGVCLN